MSITSTVSITIEEARKQAKKKLMWEHEKLVDAAIKGMDEWDLSSVINDHDNPLYYYEIGKEARRR